MCPHKGCNKWLFSILMLERWNETPKKNDRISSLMKRPEKDIIEYLRSSGRCPLVVIMTRAKEKIRCRKYVDFHTGDYFLFPTARNYLLFINHYNDHPLWLLLSFFNYFNWNQDVSLTLSANFNLANVVFVAKHNQTLTMALSHYKTYVCCSDDYSQ